MVRHSKLRKARRLPKKPPEDQLVGVKVGDVFHDLRRYKCHIVAIVNDDKGTVIVYRYYGKVKQWWHYDEM